MKIKYPCHKCGKQFTELGSMKKHIQSVHERVKFPCDKFYYQATEKTCCLSMKISSINHDHCG